jgi:hypothetical protein
MISRFRLKFGRAPGVASEPIEATPVTVFVGPNNSGKSQILSEINAFCCSGRGARRLLLWDMSFDWLTPDKAPPALSDLVASMSPERRNRVRASIPSSQEFGMRLRKFSEKTNISFVCESFLAHTTLMLNAQNRMSLVSDQPAGDMIQPAKSSLQVLFRDDAIRAEVRRIVYEAFNLYLVIDHTNLGSLKIRLSKNAPGEVDERGLNEGTIRFFSEALPISETSDGVKAFTGIVIELITGNPKVILIDEPEAFLHPSLAFKLGVEISRAARSTDKRVFASTHNPAFVMGCIQSGAPVTIVRLTYRDGVGTARVLPSGELSEFMRQPLLRSTGLLSGLFYEFVVVTESDTDRAFYQEVNERLLQFKPEWAIPNCLFIAAQNKQTVHTLMRPLRKLGVPAAGIVDVDVLKDGGSDWTNLMSGAGVPFISHGPLAAMRTAVKNAMVQTGRDMKRDGGLNILQSSDREAAENLFRQLAEYGVFVVPGGELESWLRDLNVSGKGPAWLVTLFERMGEDPAGENFIKPADGDVWKFMSSIRAWLVDPARKGIP